MQISQRIGSAANPANRADENRKQRGSRALIGISVGRLITIKQHGIRHLHQSRQ